MCWQQEVLKRQYELSLRLVLCRTEPLTMLMCLAVGQRPSTAALKLHEPVAPLTVETGVTCASKPCTRIIIPMQFAVLVATAALAASAASQALSTHQEVIAYKRRRRLAIAATCCWHAPLDRAAPPSYVQALQ